MPIQSEAAVLYDPPIQRKNYRSPESDLARKKNGEGIDPATAAYRVEPATRWWRCPFAARPNLQRLPTPGSIEKFA
jgi:hypothetical protein